MMAESGFDYPTVRIPKDPAKRAALAKMAGLTDEEHLALDAWCAQEQRQAEARLRRGLEREGDRPMAATTEQLAAEANPSGSYIEYLEERAGL